MITAVFRFLNFETFVAKLTALGVPTRPAVDEDGKQTGTRMQGCGRIA